MKKSIFKLSLICLLVSVFCFSIPVLAQIAGLMNQDGHVTLISGSGMNRIAVVESDGDALWQLSQTDISWTEVNDADMLPNGNIVFAARSDSGSTVYMVKPSYPKTTGYEILWTYKVPSGAENHTCQALPDGGVLIGEAYNTYVRIVELDSQGNVRKTLGGVDDPLESWPAITGSHNQIRQIHKTKEGTYLLAAMGAAKTIEYSSTGEKLAEYPAGGFTAVKDDSGNVIVAGGDAHTLTCFSANDGSQLWQIGQTDIEGTSLGFVASLNVLDNGNIVFANWGGHGNSVSDSVIEITVPDATTTATKIWSLNCGMATSNVQVLDDIDEAVFDGQSKTPYVPAKDSTSYRSPIDVVGSILTDLVYVADETNNTIEVICNTNGILVNELSLSQKANTLLLSADAKYLYVATGSENGKVEVFDTNTNAKVGEVAVGHTPSALALSENGRVLYVANRFDGTIQAIALTNGAVDQTTSAGEEIYVTREPMSMAISGNKLYIGGHLPTGSMTDATISSEVVVVNTSNMAVSKVITMIDGSTNLKDIALSPDGKYLYVSHALGRYNVATTHVDRGWIYTNAITEIQTSDDTVRATMLVDDLDLGAGNPWGIDVSTDKIVLSVSGTRELMILDRNGLREKIEKVYSGTLGGNGYLETPDDISVDLTFTTEYKQRIDLGEDGPRGIELMCNKIYTANYYSGSISVYDMSDDSLETIDLTTLKSEDAVRGGERLWNDATICFGQWQSCASCHPDARADALNWDNMNDGMGTPKQARSMVGSWERGRVMATGIRQDTKTANRAGLKYICFNAGFPESEMEKIDAYTASLTAEVSPYLEDGKLTESALRGKSLFEGKANCASCHSGDLYGADVLIYENYVDSDTETRGLLVPPLVEAWRTGPYLHDGSAATIMDVLTSRNVTGTHGNASDLSESELTDLCNYVLSLGTEFELPEGSETKMIEFKIEEGQLYVRYSSTEEWTLLGKVQGNDGQPGADGKTPEIKLENGNLYVRYSSTEEWTLLGQAQGNAGQPGADGKTPELKLENGNLYVRYSET